jgi:hypothetical protein
MSTQPVHSIRFGLIKCEILYRNTRAGERYSVSFSRIYRNGDQWATSTRFGRDDLPLVGKLADLAHTWIFEQSQNRQSSNPSRKEENHERE